MRHEGPARVARIVALIAATTALAVIAALLTQGSVGAINEGVESLSATSSGALDRLATLLPFGFAFGAGLVSAVNPCGFAMLPAYLGLYLRGDTATSASVAARLGRALRVGAAVTAGFVVLFGLAGLTLGIATRSLAGVFPWLGLATGLLLVGVGAWSWFGGTLYAGVGERMAQGVRGLNTGGLRGYFAFGVAYGLASLSCTLPIFLAVVGSSTTLATLPQAALQLVAYALGMGLLVTSLTLALAFFGGALVGRAKGATRYVGQASSVLMLVAGAYIVYYWLTIGGLRIGG